MTRPATATVLACTISVLQAQPAVLPSAAAAARPKGNVANAEVFWATSSAAIPSSSHTLDPAANAWGVATTWSSRWTIGAGPGAGIVLTASGNAAASPTGTLMRALLPSLQFK